MGPPAGVCLGVLNNSRGAHVARAVPRCPHRRVVLVSGCCPSPSPQLRRGVSPSCGAKDTGDPIMPQALPCRASLQPRCSRRAPGKAFPWVSLESLQRFYLHVPKSHLAWESVFLGCTRPSCPYWGGKARQEKDSLLSYVTLMIRCKSMK